MKLDINNIKALAESLEKNKLSEISVESEGVKVTLKKEMAQSSPAVREVTYSHPVYEEVEKEETASTSTEEKNEENYKEIVSPMVGTFYSSPAPGADSFISIGQNITEGDTLCIIEAMKLMNEVKSPIKGKLVKILVNNGDIVKKGDKLFLVE